MKSEGTNKIVVFIVFGLVGLYFLYGNNFTTTTKNSGISKRAASSICTEVCQNNNALVLGAMKEKGYFADEGTYQTLIDGINGICERDCNDKINE